jgi:hypothetical protein
MAYSASAGCEQLAGSTAGPEQHKFSHLPTSNYIFDTTGRK